MTWILNFCNEQQRSADAKARRALHKLNHRMSRKGYSGLLEEMVSAVTYTFIKTFCVIKLHQLTDIKFLIICIKCSETGLTEDEIDRSELWKRGRLMKEGGYHPDVLPVVKTIVSFLYTCYQ